VLCFHKISRAIILTDLSRPRESLRRSVIIPRTAIPANITRTRYHSLRIVTNYDLPQSINSCN